MKAAGDLAAVEYVNNRTRDKNRSGIKGRLRGETQKMLGNIGIELFAGFVADHFQSLFF
jgi:hypothetical protein